MPSESCTLGYGTRDKGEGTMLEVIGNEAGLEQLKG
jgi:hypothetical protein